MIHDIGNWPSTSLKQHRGTCTSQIPHQIPNSYHVPSFGFGRFKLSRAGSNRGSWIRKLTYIHMLMCGMKFALCENIFPTCFVQDQLGMCLTFKSVKINEILTLAMMSKVALFSWSNRRTFVLPSAIWRRCSTSKSELALNWLIQVLR